MEDEFEALDPTQASTDQLLKGFLYFKSLAKDNDAQREELATSLEEFQASSRELEQELERDLASTEQRETQLRIAHEKVVAELDDWRARYQTSLKEHTVTLGHMQKELESVRASEAAIRTTIRDMELDNDDLEKSERALESTLSDIESRYGKAIERTILLEEELVAKARLEEDVQRLKDELREANEELSVLKELQTRIIPERPANPVTPNGKRQLSSSTSSVTSSRPASPTPSTSALSQSQNGEDTMPTPKKASDLRRPISSAIPRSTSTPDVLATRQSSIPLRHSPSISPSITANRRPITTRPTKRNETMLSDLRSMTSRVKNMTARVDSRRTSAIPAALPRARKSSLLTQPEMPPPPVPSKRPTPLPRASRMSEDPVRSASPTNMQRPRPQSRLSTMSSSYARPVTPSQSRSPTPSTSPKKLQGRPNGVGFGSSVSTGRLPSALPTPRPSMVARTPISRRVSVKRPPVQQDVQEELRDDETF